jgi:RimJ/RimL family protein N-acetyltransferase
MGQQIIRTMAETVDKTGTPILIKHTNEIGWTPVLTFFMKNYTELIESGHGHPVFTANNTNSAIYAEIDGKVVGHILYNILDDQIKTAWIILSAVDKDYRQRGIYNLMHTQFEKVIKTAGSKKIASHVHVNNLARQASCESAGMKKVWYKMEKDL